MIKETWNRCPCKLQKMIEQIFNSTCQKHSARNTAKQILSQLQIEKPHTWCAWKRAQLSTDQKSTDRLQPQGSSKLVKNTNFWTTFWSFACQRFDTSQEDAWIDIRGCLQEYDCIQPKLTSRCEKRNALLYETCPIVQHVTTACQQHWHHVQSRCTSM